MKKKIEIATIPELGTSVGLHGSMKQTEVIGVACATLAAMLFFIL